MKKPATPKPRKKQTGAANLKATGRKATYIYLLESDMDLIREAAAQSNRSIANFATQAVIEKAKRILSRAPCPKCGSAPRESANPDHQLWECGSWRKDDGTESHTKTCFANARNILENKE
jgi:hypothetical protein